MGGDTSNLSCGSKTRPRNAKFRTAKPISQLSIYGKGGLALSLIPSEIRARPHEFSRPKRNFTIEPVVHSACT